MSKKNPHFSIITCTLNSEKYLNDCLLSIKNQTFTDFEIIIVDGGSTDNTLSIAESFDKVVVINNITGGISNAMNVGIFNSNGAIISILHSDDYYYSHDTLKIVYNSFLENPYNFWLFGDVARKVGNNVNLVENSAFNLEYFKHTSIIPHPGVFIKSLIYKELGLFNVDLKYAMDYDILLRISKKFQPIQVNSFLSVFRIHESSLSSKNWYKAQNELLIVQLRNADTINIKFKSVFRYLKTRLKYFVNNIKPLKD
jgi:glycosyltransferase involved in cell wall biosynthesis